MLLLTIFSWLSLLLTNGNDGYNQYADGVVDEDDDDGNNDVQG